MDHPFLNSNTKTGTVCGTMLVLLFRLNGEDLLVSAILAGTGAAVSFLVSVFLKWLLGRIRRKYKGGRKAFFFYISQQNGIYRSQSVS